MDKKFKHELKSKVEEGSALNVTDGKHVMLSCSNCEMDLVDIWITKPDSNISLKMTASCGFCGDKSFSQIIKGGFHLGITDKTKIGEMEQVDDDADVIAGEVDAAYLITTIDDRR